MIQTTTQKTSQRIYELAPGWDTEGLMHWNKDRIECPTYDLAFLLEKLGNQADDYRIAVLTNDGKRWVANRTTANTVEQSCESDNPTEAAGLLAIKLFEEGVIT